MLNPTKQRKKSYNIESERYEENKLLKWNSEVGLTYQSKENFKLLIDENGAGKFKK